MATFDVSAAEGCTGGVASSHGLDHQFDAGEENGQQTQQKTDKKMSSREGASSPAAHSPSFDIPELPSGQTLLFELLSSWGDDCLIGLRSVQIFSANGTIPSMAHIQSNASEMISGTLQLLFRMPKIGGKRGEGMEGERENGGRSNEEDGTGGGGSGDETDEMWLCKYTDEEQQQNRRLSSSPIQIVVHFHTPQTLAMIRILNYFCLANAQFALRGVRNLRIWLDNQCIFCGEICCALNGDASGVDSSTIGDTILFTTNDEILAQIAENDEVMAANGGVVEEEKRSTGQSERDGDQRKDSTEQREKCHCAGTPSVQDDIGCAAFSRLVPLTRPTTGNYFGTPAPSSPCEKCNRQKGTEQEAEGGEDANAVTEPSDGRQEMEGRKRDKWAEEEGTENAVVGRVFHMELLANWGCPDAIGLTGIQFLGPKFESIDDLLAKKCVVRCEHNGTDQCSKEEGHLENLVNGTNLTCKMDEMWLCSAWNAQEPAPMLSFTFPCEIQLCGISVWNYNGSPELSYAGVRCARFYANGKTLPIGMVLLRKAPGVLFFDFVQDVLFGRGPSVGRPLLSPRPQTCSIAAFIFQIRLLSSWGDEFYIGLNGIELFDRHDMPIQLLPQNLAAFPESVNCLAAVSGDPRSSDKLIDGVNDTAKTHHMWLTPILPNSCARVFFIFDMPTFVTKIRIYNYRKTAERGVRHIAVWLSADDLLLCSGAEVPMSSPEKTGILDVSLRDGD